MGQHWHVPADKDLPPTALQRSLVRHKSAWRFGVVAFAVAVLAFSIWTSLDGRLGARAPFGDDNVVMWHFCRTMSEPRSTCDCGALLDPVNTDIGFEWPDVASPYSEEDRQARLTGNRLIVVLDLGAFVRRLLGCDLIAAP